jgi:hypothetical protein
MNKINELNIKINKAVITKVTIELDIETNEPTWTVQGALITSTNKKVSDFVFSSETWYSEDKRLKVPSYLHLPARDIFEAFTPVIYEKLGETFLALPQGK